MQRSRRRAARADLPAPAPRGRAVGAGRGREDCPTPRDAAEVPRARRAPGDDFGIFWMFVIYLGMADALDRMRVEYPTASSCASPSLGPNARRTCGNWSTELSRLGQPGDHRPLPASQETDPPSPRVRSARPAPVRGPILPRSDNGEDRIHVRWPVSRRPTRDRTRCARARAEHHSRGCAERRGGDRVPDAHLPARGTRVAPPRRLEASLLAYPASEGVLAAFEDALAP